MKYLKTFTLPTLALSLCLTGCGKDEEAQKQISELQDRLLTLEKDLASLKELKKLSKDNYEYLEYLKPRIKRSEEDVQKLISGLASSNPSNTTKAFQTPSELKAAETAINNSQLSLEHKKSIALIKAYLRSKPISAIPEILNTRNALHPDDNSKWDVQKLTRFIELYKIPKTSK